MRSILPTGLLRRRIIIRYVIFVVGVKSDGLEVDGGTTDVENV